jgi:hypothetical protein
MSLKDFHWLLFISKNQIRYAEQATTWNKLLVEFRTKNKGLRKVPDHLGQPVSADSCFQD